MLELTQIPPNSAPIDLLLEADPSKSRIEQYLSKSDCYAAKLEGEVIGVCVMVKTSDTCVELFNIATKPSLQAKGLGGQLLRYALQSEKNKGTERIELGTGTFGHQLSFYQRHGFRVDRVIKNYFLDSYDDAIYENGIQHKDMLRLVSML